MQTFTPLGSLPVARVHRAEVKTPEEEVPAEQQFEPQQLGECKQLPDVDLRCNIKCGLSFGGASESSPIGGYSRELLETNRLAVPTVC